MIRHTGSLPRYSACCAYLIGLGAALSPLAAAAGRGQYELPATREALVQTLRHQEGLVRSAECEYDLIVSSTRAEMVPLLKTFFKLKGNEQEANAYITSDRTARQRSRHVRWWRQGQMERIEESDPDTPSKVEKITAFNGQVRRVLNYRENPPLGNILSPDHSAWLTMNRFHPFAFLYTSFEIPFSDIVEKGKDFRLVRERRGGQVHVRVAVRHPRTESFGYELLFGKGGLLQERRLLDEVGKKDARRWSVLEITRLSDYRRHELPQGESIWFPHQAVVGYYVGQLPDGTLVEWQTQTIRVKDIRFNVDIPDAMFTLDFPREAPVFDGLTGRNDWLEPGVRPAAVFYPESQGRRRLLWIGGASVIGVILLGAVVLYFRRKRRSGLVTS